MKTLITLFLTAFFFASTFAQTGINYKAIVKDSNGNILASSPVSIQFTIYEGVALTNAVYEELHTTNTDANGLVIVSIGEGATGGVFAAISWENDAHYLNVQINTGANFVDLGTTQFKVVPYALHAKIATMALNAGASSIDGLSDGKADVDGSSLFLGVDAGANDDGTNNVNVGIGYQALSLNTTGSNNTANGRHALRENTTGSSNTANGTNALKRNTTGSNNTANGSIALARNTTGFENTANGHAALLSNTTGSRNTANGNDALFSNLNGGNNTANGHAALFFNTIGSSNTANGCSALYENTSGDDNTANGSNALGNNTTGTSNTANGRNALRSNATGSNNTANGRSALFKNTTGNENTANGHSALFDNTTGNENTANGYRALENNIVGSGNVALGYRAGGLETGSHTLYIENSDISTPLIYGEFDNDILGFNGDVAIGHQDPLAPLHIKKDGVTNTQTIVAVLEAAISKRPTLLFSETVNVDSTAGMSIEYNGSGSGGNNKIVLNGIGGVPLFELQNSGDLKILDGDLSISKGASDTAIRMADFNGDLDRVLLRQTSTNDVYVGDVDNNGGNLVIRAAGNNVLHAKSSGFVGIGTSTPTRQLQLSTNSAGKPGSATWDVTSDRRLKKDITPFNDGLETLKSIDPVWFTYNGLAGMPIETNVGAIAQDLKKVAPYLIKDWKYTDDEGRTENYLGVNYGPLTFIMVNAIKEQAQEIEDLKASITNLQTVQAAEIEAIQLQLARLEN